MLCRTIRLMRKRGRGSTKPTTAIDSTAAADAGTTAIPGPSRTRAWAYAIPALLCIVAMARLYRAPELAANLDLAPDSGEYAIAAQRFAKLGTCSIAIEGTAYPIRYPPSFSILVLAPFYAAAPVDMLGVGIVPVYVLAIAAILSAYAIGRRIAGVWGGAIAGMLLLDDGNFGFHAQQVATDVPVVALLLLLTLALARASEHPSRARWWWWIAGILAALAGSFRVLAYAGVLPILWQAFRTARMEDAKRPLVHRFAAALVPSIAFMIATAIYNHHAFGDWRRNGYQLWVGVPYDYLGLTFSLRYVRDNLNVLREIAPALAAGAIGIVGLAWQRRRRQLDVRHTAPLVALALVAVPMSIVHLVYFYVGGRFHLPLVALLAIVGGSGIALLVPAKIREAAPWLLCIPLAIVAVHRTHREQTLTNVPYRYLAARCMTFTEPNAVIVTAIEPVYLEPMVTRGTQRQVIPLSRGVEYASKVLTWQRVPPPLVPPPTSAFDHRALALLRGGAREAVAFTADENPDRIVELRRAGFPIYLDLTFTSPDDPAAQRLAQLFQSLGRPIGLPTEPVPP